MLPPVLNTVSQTPVDTIVAFSRYYVKQWFQNWVKAVITMASSLRLRPSPPPAGPTPWPSSPRDPNLFAWEQVGF